MFEALLEFYYPRIVAACTWCQPVRGVLAQTACEQDPPSRVEASDPVKPTLLCVHHDQRVAGKLQISDCGEFARTGSLPSKPAQIAAGVAIKGED